MDRSFRYKCPIIETLIQRSSFLNDCRTGGYKGLKFSILKIFLALFDQAKKKMKITTKWTLI